MGHDRRGSWVQPVDGDRAGRRWVRAGHRRASSRQQTIRAANRFPPATAGPGVRSPMAPCSKTCLPSAHHDPLRSKRDVRRFSRADPGRANPLDHDQRYQRRPVGETPTVYDADFVIYRLEEAGETLLAIPGSGWSTKLRTSSLEIVRTALESMARTSSTIRPPVPSADKITRMDEAMSWLTLIPTDRYVLRRVVGPAASSTLSPIGICSPGAAWGSPRGRSQSDSAVARTGSGHDRRRP